MYLMKSSGSTSVSVFKFFDVFRKFIILLSLSLVESNGWKYKERTGWDYLSNNNDDDNMQ